MEEMKNILTGETVTIECPKKEQIIGYRELTRLERNEISKVKKMEQELLTVINNICEDNLVHPDPRWVAIARTSLEQGFMAMVRSIAKPETVRMPNQQIRA